MEAVLLVAVERGRPFWTVVAGTWCRVETVKGMRKAGNVTLEENGCQGRVQNQGAGLLDPFSPKSLGAL